jgi:hypothetical protein
LLPANLQICFSLASKGRRLHHGRDYQQADIIAHIEFSASGTGFYLEQPNRRLLRTKRHRFLGLGPKRMKRAIWSACLWV